ncbi:MULTISPECIES: AI-2E family transporter [Pseudomonas]|uniref:AI-2E family transporter n=2 Tax=Pseudomonas TaxID=286 RepID=A0ABS0MMI5_PSELU|nr:MULTISPECIES: AI-2E family transporter [Pseudomonas]MBH3437922.1 AI-2E family transporter [Pseudomonas luteola]MBW5414355.1 AI-2E family transporter [Pseudomonas sp. MAG002Y]SEQ34781.1 Predicted PurR-regulated permease PerM [Pseudomonas lutea]
MTTRRWYVIGGLAVLLWLLHSVQPILSPFLISMLLAYLGDPLVDRLERLGLSRTLAVLTVYLAFLLVLLGMLLVIVPMLVRQFIRLYELMPAILDWLQFTALPWIQIKFGLADSFWRFDRIKAVLTSHLDRTGDIVGIVLAQATSSSLALLAWIGNTLLIPVVSFYLLRDWDVMVGKLRGLLPRRHEGLVARLLGDCHEVLGAFLRGQLMVMLGLGIIYAGGLMLVGLELGLLIGLLAGLASIVPYMGFAVGITAAMAAGFFQFGLDWYPLLGILAVFVFGQMIEGMVLTPLLVGDRIGLHPVAVIFAVLAGGQLFGFSGILLALPVAAVLMVLLRHIHDLYKLSDLYSKPGRPESSEPPDTA